MTDEQSIQTMTDKWYEHTSAQTPLTQGDVIVDCPVLSWENTPFELTTNENHEEELKGSVAAVQADVVVMSQACDLQQEKIANVILCPCLPLSVFKEFWQTTMKEQGQNPTEKAWKRLCEDMKDGFQWKLALLNAGTAEDLKTEHLIVDFHEVFSIPRSFLESFLTQRNRPRLRLLPPYREHLSQAFARYFMRVGLPAPVRKAW